MRRRFRKARPKPCGKTMTAGGSKASATKCISLETDRGGMILRAIIQHDSGGDQPRSRTGRRSYRSKAVTLASRVQAMAGGEMRLESGWRGGKEGGPRR